MNSLDTLVKGIIASIPGKHIFDTHTVIQMLIQGHTDDYLVNARSFSTVELYHAHIGQAISKIAKLPGTVVEDIGAAYSKNIKDDFSECECWRKI